jgi:hypothetical protein
MACLVPLFTSRGLWILHVIDAGIHDGTDVFAYERWADPAHFEETQQMVCPLEIS